MPRRRRGANQGRNTHNARLLQQQREAEDEEANANR